MPPANEPSEVDLNKEDGPQQSADAVLDDDAAAEHAESDETEVAYEEEASEEDDVDGEEGDDDTTQAGSNLLKLGALIGAALLIAVTAVAAFFIYKYNDKSGELDDQVASTIAQSQAKDAACEYVNVLVNYDFSTIDDWIKKVSDGASGQWKKEFDASAPALKEAFAADQVKGQGDNPECGVKSGNATNAQVVIVVAQNIATAKSEGKFLPGPTISVVMDMEKTDGRWLATTFNAPFLGGQ
ncbi:hypothetical protein JGU71_27440 [Antrihabitans sp. YC3-6]|uniref:Mce-associated membrane protein n=1 Tax=Antrihabitans stalagmiti TaxID=2799499 RepID=A0A934U6K4_9NOCA|nr:hypothetical protein [Antrihabitans stalagmiti]MBJ8342629.1 hypothetical protein [Antrihabitans stalagmiti]